jgi:hypothetical protein
VVPFRSREGVRKTGPLCLWFIKVLSPAAQNKNGMVADDHHPVFAAAAESV